MNPGRRDQFVMVQRASSVADEIGGRTHPDWLDVGGVWAAVKPVRFGEQQRQGAVRALDAQIFTVPTESIIELAVTEQDRLMWEGDSYNIREVRKVSRRTHMTEIVAEGGVTE